MRRTIILSAALAIIVLGLWGTVVILFDEARLKGLVSDRLGEQIGRRVEIVGGLEFDLFPRPRVVAQDVVLGRPHDSTPFAALRAERLSMSLEFLPLLQGKLAAGQVELEGAVINLRGAEKNRRQKPGNALAALRSSARLFSGRSLRLRDVRVLMPEGQHALPRAIIIDLIELERFSLDETVAFRFQGDLGEPALLEQVNAQGHLHVPLSTASPIRLRGLNITGRFAGTQEQISLSGELVVSGEGPLRISLAGGQLRTAHAAFDLSLNLHGGSRPALDLLFSGRELDWLAVHRVPFGNSTLSLSSLLAVLSDNLDLRSQVQLDVLQLGEVGLSQVRIDLRSRPTGLGLNLAGVFPGGLLEAEGNLRRANLQSLSLDISLASARSLLEWLQLPPAVEGSGEAMLSLRWPHNNDGGYQLAGRFELWDGRLALAYSQEAPEMHSFDQFSGEMRLIPGYLEMPAFTVSGEQLVASGWAALELPGATLGGVLHIDAAQTPFPFRLFGSLAAPRLSPLGPTRDIPRQKPSAGHEGP